MKQRIDQRLSQLGLVSTRSQAESYIRLGQVLVNKKVITKPGFLVSETDDIRLTAKEQYVSRAGLKLASVAQKLKLNFGNKTVLDVGSSTGGFTDFALQHGADRVVAVEVGTSQLHPSLHGNPKIELHEKTDIRDYIKSLDASTTAKFDIVVMDVSFISLREILPHIRQVAGKNTQIVAMLKPQFEATLSGVKHKGVIKNDTMRRKIISDFEIWVKNLFVIVDKFDSEVAGAKGNRERFYLLKKS